MLGLSPETDAGAVYRAILESIAFGFATVDDQLSAVLGASPAIVASGGALAHSPLLAQILADTLGRDIGVAPSDKSSRRGAALLALRGTGLRGRHEAIPIGTLRRVHNDPARTARYQVARERRDALYRRVLG